MTEKLYTERLAEESKGLHEQIERLKSELAGARGFLEAVLEHIPEAIAIVDSRDFTVRMVSKCCRELLGHPKEKLEGITYSEYSQIHGFLDVDGAPTPSEKLPPIRAALKGQVLKDEASVLRRSDGKELDLLCNSGPIFDRHGHVIAGIAIWRDITEQKRAEEELRIKHITARKDMEQELEAKSYRLKEVNFALKALLRQRDEDRKEFEEALLTNIENLILPYIKRLKSSSHEQLTGLTA